MTWTNGAETKQKMTERAEAHDGPIRASVCHNQQTGEVKVFTLDNTTIGRWIKGERRTDIVSIELL